jgi:hypothetical protein
MSIQNNFPAIRPSLLLDFANTRQLDPRITFTRASTATFYDGRTVAKAEENLFERSQEIDNAYWSRFQIASIEANTGDTTAPDGTSTAEKVTVTASAGSIFRVNGATAGVVSFSCFAKAGTSTSFKLDAAVNGNGRECTFDLSAGTASSVANIGAGTNVTGGTSSIQNMGNGWYRCVISNLTVVAANINPGLVVNSTGTMYLWGAQVEQRSAVTAYTPTTTAPITNYIPALQTAAAGVARFEHNPITGESLGLEIEEQRTNLLTYSEQFNDAAWTKTRISIAANTVVAPDGGLTGDKLIEDTSNNTHQVQFSFIPAASTAYTYSVYLKAAERSFALVQLTFGGLNTFAIVNLATGSVGSVTGTGTVSATAVGNGWFRVSITATTTSTVSGFANVYTCSDSTTFTYTGNGFNGIFIWGAQLEAGAFPTSYIPTVASQVTRSADAASMTGANFSSWYNAAEGTVYSECLFTASSQVAYSINSGSTANRMFAWANTTTTNNFRVITNDNVQVDLTSTASINTFNKQAAAYATNNFASVVNGGIVGTDASGLVPAVNRLQIGNDPSGASLFGTIRKIAYYPLRVTNAQLQGLTTV